MIRRAKTCVEDVQESYVLKCFFKASVGGRNLVFKVPRAYISLHVYEYMKEVGKE